ncbi:MAG: tRNA threonylcarbamoyladenosine dehydratase [Verrucomicrobia bacterium]|jgi:tRNA A37 threonylcarbamoyladenosine dehydratase|nr:tRNA threonylcarbamoyladenosine dehydratase [Verrucomicrobiota bacterium]
MRSFDLRFGGIRRLYSKAGLEALRRSHVCVVGVGGVGSWTVEALARSGIGRLTLVDMDDVCVSNVNRQIHALDGEIKKTKVAVMAHRVRAINPDIDVRPIEAFLTPGNAASLLDDDYDYVFDAIDRAREKCLMIVLCRQRGLPILTAGGAGGRRDPMRIRVDDLARSEGDRLLQSVRRTLRADHGFPRGGKKFGVECVYSSEPPVYPRPDGSVCEARPAGAELRLDCRSGFGTATFVTGTFGFVAAARMVEEIATRKAIP